MYSPEEDAKIVSDVLRVFQLGELTSPPVVCSGGWVNHTLRLETTSGKYICRISPDFISYTELCFTVALLDFLHTKELPVPRLLEKKIAEECDSKFIFRTDDQMGIVTEFCEGQFYVAEPPYNTHAAWSIAEVASLLGRLHAETMNSQFFGCFPDVHRDKTLHFHPGKVLRRIRKHLADYQRDFPDLAKSIIAHAERELDVNSVHFADLIALETHDAVTSAVPANTQLVWAIVHFDFHDENAFFDLRDKRVIMLLDWDEAAAAPAVCDIALALGNWCTEISTVTTESTLNYDKVRLFIKCYEEARGLRLTKVEQLAVRSYAFLMALDQIAFMMRPDSREDDDSGLLVKYTRDYLGYLSELSGMTHEEFAKKLSWGDVK